MRRSPSRLPWFRSQQVIPFVAIAVCAASSGMSASAHAPLDAYPTSLDEVLTRFPSVEANEAALALEALSARIGVDLAPRSLPERSHPSPEGRRVFDDSSQALGQYVWTELRRTKPGVTAPPDSVVSFLALERGNLDAIRDNLLAGGAPVWERRVELLLAAPIPNLLGHLHLQNILIAAALDRRSAGDVTGAVAYLEASWQLNRSLRDEPWLISQLMAVSIARKQIGALRRIPDVPATWIERLREHDYRGSVTTALWLEGWMWGQESPAEVIGDKGVWATFVLTVAKPYYRLCLDDASDRWAEQLARLPHVASLCEVDLPSLDGDLRESVPWWNGVAAAVFPQISSILQRIGVLEVELEMTSLILDVASYRRRAGVPPTALPYDSSPACPMARWRYARGDDGQFVLELDRTIDWGLPMGSLLPTRYEGGAVDERADAR